MLRGTLTTTGAGMARTARLRHGWLRPIVTLSALVFAAGGLVALEHTATGATTASPSHHYAASHYDSRHDSKCDSKCDDGKHPDGKHHRHCNDGHGQDNVKNKHCRPPSGV